LEKYVKTGETTSSNGHAQILEKLNKTLANKSRGNYDLYRSAYKKANNRNGRSRCSGGNVKK
jgi:hypothetical protein